MELSEAMEMATPRPMDVDELGQHLSAVHADNPQREMLARRALAMVREGLQHLASLGHALAIVHSPTATPLEFPRMLYQQGKDPMIVENQVDLDKALADGWSKEQATPRVPDEEVNPPAAPQPDKSSTGQDSTNTGQWTPNQ